ncbi:MAG: zinc-ribbon domain-containing protein, partial [Leptospira sp.]|nr:zinc-ribbon domain-containing protein [Leptospira sp.]
LETLRDLRTEFETGKSDPGEFRESSAPVIEELQSIDLNISEKNKSASVEKSAEPVAGSYKPFFCHSCGFKIEIKGANFCPSCGTKL